MFKHITSLLLYIIPAIITLFIVISFYRSNKRIKNNDTQKKLDDIKTLVSDSVDSKPTISYPAKKAELSQDYVEGLAMLGNAEQLKQYAKNVERIKTKPKQKTVKQTLSELHIKTSDEVFESDALNDSFNSDFDISYDNSLYNSNSILNEYNDMSKEMKTIIVADVLKNKSDED